MYDFKGKPEDKMTQDDWKQYLGIEEEREETVSVDDVEGAWEDVRKL